MTRERRPYPKHKRRYSGHKVGWLYYDNEADALTASEAAKHNARIDEALGYDWGYQMPGSVELKTTGEYAGLWQVCIP